MPKKIVKRRNHSNDIEENFQSKNSQQEKM